MTNVFNSSAAAKTLTLRGMNNDPNQITSNLNDNGGVLNVTKSDGGNWILSGTNNFTGTLTINGGSLGATTTAAALGAPGTGSISFSNGYLYGLGAPLNISRAVILGVNANTQFTGDQSMAFLWLLDQRRGPRGPAADACAGPCRGAAGTRRRPRR